MTPAWPLTGRAKELQFIAAAMRPAADGPSNVATAIEHALTARRPRPRRLVGADACALVTLRAALPTRVLDAAWSHALGLARTPRTTAH